MANMDEHDYLPEIDAANKYAANKYAADHFYYSSFDLS